MKSIVPEVNFISGYRWHDEQIRSFDFDHAGGVGVWNDWMVEVAAR